MITSENSRDITLCRAAASPSLQKIGIIRTSRQGDTSGSGPVQTRGEPCAGMSLVITLLLLTVTTAVTRRQEILTAVGSNVTFQFGPCAPEHVYKIHHRPVTIHLPCDYKGLIPQIFQGRTSVDKAAGLFTIHNVTKSDAGYYDLEHVDPEGIKDFPFDADVKVLDAVWIYELSRNDTDTTISLTVVCNGGDQGPISWTIDGGVLPDRYWLSQDNRTLTVLRNITGVFTVNTYNGVSAERKSISVIQDLNGIGDYSGRVMYPNITKVMWCESRDRADNQTLILQRNISDICVLTRSEMPGDPALPYRSPERFGWLGLLIILIMIAAIVAYKKYKSAKDGETKEANGKNDCANQSDEEKKVWEMCT